METSWDDVEFCGLKGDKQYLSLLLINFCGNLEYAENCLEKGLWL